MLSGTHTCPLNHTLFVAKKVGIIAWNKAHTCLVVSQLLNFL